MVGCKISITRVQRLIRLSRGRVDYRFNCCNECTEKFVPVCAKAHPDASIMQRDPRPGCACAIALLSDTFSPCYNVASHRSITSRVIFSSPSVSRLFLASFGPPCFAHTPSLSLRSCPIQLTFILSRSRCAELCISEGVKRHNAAILLGAGSKFAEVRMAVGSYPRGPLSDLSPDYYWQAREYSISKSLEGRRREKKKKLGRILQRWKFASHRQQGGHFSPVMCAILYKIIYDSRERERERACFLGYRCETICPVNSPIETSRGKTFLEKDFSFPERIKAD